MIMQKVNSYNDFIFCFGSNEAGRHGLGAAKTAKKRFGAIYGQGYGFQGNSFAIPTKDKELKVLPLSAIKSYIDRFLIFVKDNPSLNFYITRIGCGLSGYKDIDIAHLFNNFPSNCIFDIKWKKILGNDFNYFEENL